MDHLQLADDLAISSWNATRKLTPDTMIYWPTVSIKCQTAAMAVCGCKHHPHVLNEMKGQMRRSKSSSGSPSMLASLLSASKKWLTHSPDGKWKISWMVWCGMKLLNEQQQGSKCDHLLFIVRFLLFLFNIKLKSFDVYWIHSSQCVRYMCVWL